MSSSPVVPEKAEAPVLTPEERQERRRLYNETVRKANLVNIYLSKVNFEVNRERAAKMSTPDLSYGSEIERFLYNSEKGACLISVKWKVNIKSAGKHVAKCIAVYEVAYDNLPHSSEDVLRIFADNIAVSNTYSYFRSLFATMDWGANLRSPPLPVLKLFPKV